MLRKILVIATPILVLVGAVFAIIILGELRSEPETVAEAPAGTAVFVDEAEQTDLTLTVVTQGEVRPRREIDLIPQVGGRVVAVSPAFIDGGVFEEGDTLVQIERADYELAVTRARANVADAQQALEREEAESRLAREEWEELGEGEATSLALRLPQLDQARARLAASEASLREAELALSRATIRAPFSGRMRSKSADIGQYVSPGQSLGRVFSTDSVEIRLPLTDAQLGLVGLPLAFFAGADEIGPAVRLEATVAGQPRSWEGHIVRTDAAIDPQTRVVYAIAEVQDPYGAGADGDAPLAVGLFVNAVIEGRHVQDAVTIPRAGLRNLDEVYVLSADDTLDIRQVEVVNAGPERAVLRGGVAGGEMIVVSPIQTATQGMNLVPLPVDGANDRGAALAAAGSGDAT